MLIREEVFTDGKDKDIDKDITKGLQTSFTDKTTEGYCNICNTGYNKKMNTVDQMNIKKMLNRKKLDDKKWRDKLVS